MNVEREVRVTRWARVLVAAATTSGVVGVAATGAAAGGAERGSETRVFHEPAERTMRVELKGTGTGRVFGQGIDCPGDCVEKYEEGTHVTLEAAAARGSSFGGYDSGEYGSDCSGNTCSFAMNIDRHVVATFITHRFQFGRVQRNTRSGTATLAVTLPGPGELSLAGRGTKPLPRGTKPVSEAGKVSLKIRPKGQKKRKLTRRGTANVFARVTYKPTDGIANAKTKKVTLKLKRRR